MKGNKIPKYLVKQANDLKIEYKFGKWCIVRKSDGVCMLSQIPSRQEAEDIINKVVEEAGK